MRKYIGILIVSIIFISCAPKVYVLDRHTIMEQEASGDWPELNSQVIRKSKKPDVTFFRKDLKNKKKKRVLNIINGELILKK